MDTPFAGEGDIESLASIRRIHKFCRHPMQIECRETSSQGEASKAGQTVTCNLQTGFQCLNAQNGGQCKDYEVRFYCPCVCKYYLLLR